MSTLCTVFLERLIPYLLQLKQKVVRMSDFSIRRVSNQQDSYYSIS